MNDRCTRAWTTRVDIPWTLWVGHVSVPNRDDTVTGHSCGHPQAPRKIKRLSKVRLRSRGSETERESGGVESS